MESIKVVDVADEAFPSELFEQENAFVVRTFTESSPTKDTGVAYLTICGGL